MICFGDLKMYYCLVFIGHVDAGKSTIGGQIIRQTGPIDLKTNDDDLRYSLDTNEEERRRGKTVEVGTAHFTIGDGDVTKHFTLIHAPGHRGFVPNMISGTAQADIAVLVVSARRGEFETGFEKNGQTKEHASLARMMGIKHLVVLVNKMDDHTVNWRQDRFHQCKEAISMWLKKIGYRNVSFIPCSGITGANIRKKTCSWYSGPTFFELLDTLSEIDRRTDCRLRLPIVGKYKDTGLVVLGKIESGTCTRRQHVLIEPGRFEATIDTLSCHGEDVNRAEAGQLVKMKLKGVDDARVAQGMVVCDEGFGGATEVTAQLVFTPSQRGIVCAGYKAMCHIHTCVEEATLADIVCTLDKKTGCIARKKPRFVRPDEVIIVRMVFARPVCVERFTDFERFGRIVLRSDNKTVAFGKILTR